MTDLNGWTHVGYYGFCRIYAKDGRRCLVDPKTGRVTFEYWVTTNGTGRSTIKLAELVSSKTKRG